MKIRYTEYVADPKLRNTETNLPAHVAQVLIAQGSAVHIPYKDFRERLAAEASPAAQPGKTTWSVGAAQQTQQIELRARCSRGCTFRYSGPIEIYTVKAGPGQIALVDPSKSQFQHSCGAQPEVIPVEIWKEYCSASPRNALLPVTADVAEMLAMAHHIGSDNKHAESEWGGDNNGTK